MRLIILPALLLGLFSSSATAQKTDPWLKELLYSQASPALKNILDHPDSFRYQILYTRIDRDKRNRPFPHSYFYRVNSLEYFNPASTVKLPLALLALEKINSLHGVGIDKYTPLLTDSAYGGQTPVQSDTSSNDGLPSIAQYIKKIFLTSDNDAYNRLYEFLGQEFINRALWKKGYKEMRITRRFVPMTEEENRHTNPIRFVKEGRTLYSQPAAISGLSFDFSHRYLLGYAYYDRHDSLIHQPMDFTRHNNFPLVYGRDFLLSVLAPEVIRPGARFNLSPEDRRFLAQYMSEYPRESTHPKYDTSEYFDSYTKFFLFKSGRSPIPPYIRVFNKPGWSYGFLTDHAYLVDFKNNVEFMLSATIYVNSDGVLNDDKYDYDGIGYPFFKEVGEIIYRYELGRKRKYIPDLQSFKLQYDQP